MYPRSPVGAPSVELVSAMDAFEQVIAELLWRNGYWVQTSFKVELTKLEKIKIGRPSSPRWEIDIVAYKGSVNEVLAIECKSYLDSPGVRASAFDGSDQTYAGRFKLFNEQTTRRVVLGRLRRQLHECGLSAPRPSIRLGLAVGNFYNEASREFVNV